MDSVRSSIRALLGTSGAESSAELRVHEEVRADGFSRKSVSYRSLGVEVDAFLFEPLARAPELAVVALHQHNSQWHLGKSEIAGLAGDPWQAFGPALARAGVAVLAPDAIGFESRRTSISPPEAALALAPPQRPERGGTAEDWLHYYNAAMHRLVRGELLMRDVLCDVENAVTALQRFAPTAKIGLFGHSYGGNTALFAAALDLRVAFAVSSGAVCSYRYKRAHGIGLEMALVIPGFATRFDFDDLMRCIAPRELFVVSSEQDPFSADAEELVASARGEFETHGASERLKHLRAPGPHPLDADRFAAIVEWILSRG